MIVRNKLLDAIEAGLPSVLGENTSLFLNYDGKKSVDAFPAVFVTLPQDAVSTYTDTDDDAYDSPSTMFLDISLELTIWTKGKYRYKRLNEIRQECANWLANKENFGDYVQDIVFESYEEDEDVDKEKSIWELNGTMTYTVVVNAT